MATKKKLLMGAAGNAAGGAGLDITDVFSTYLYTGTGSAQTITNGIDLAGEGGLIWTKKRNIAGDHNICYTDAGTGTRIIPNETLGLLTGEIAVQSFNSDGVTFGSDSAFTQSGTNFASWTFRKAPKFFDVVTWTGDGVAGREIPHNLGSTPGMVIVKKTAGGFGDGWMVNHRSVPSTQFLVLNATQAASTTSTRWNDTDPTDTVFTVGNDTSVNTSGYTYVAYLFAHNDGDGGFGPDADQDIIKCGSYTGNGLANGPVIDLGFEPQWLLIKNADYGAAGWTLWDNMRGVTTGGTDQRLYANESSAEGTTGGDDVYFTSTGFGIGVEYQYVNNSGDNIIYMAIRRGPLAPPESGTEVFDVDSRAGASGNVGAYSSGFPVDMAFHKVITSSINPYEIGSRLTQGKSMNTTDTSAEVTQSDQQYDYMDGWNTDTSASSTKYSWMWKRAPSFFDVVAYTGNSTAGRTVSHNLGVAPEMMWVRKRSSASLWRVYHKGLNGGTNPEQYGINLNETAAEYDLDTLWNDTAPTASVFTLGIQGNVNGSGSPYIAYLFASLDGISKVGSYTGNGTSQTIDCGFTSGARFILIKKASGTGSWVVHDAERGIVSGNDPTLLLNSTSAEITTIDPVDPDSTGFIVNNFGDWNNSGDTYIFYAIA